ncbi:hypothetical protein DENSPDRAFT_845941 [Dentipellis sp. KUC8613]|nr:hypothetical protein DENSPDRAFT_845941 [Dentipellis sp. KUC8613]
MRSSAAVPWRGTPHRRHVSLLAAVACPRGAILHPSDGRASSRSRHSWPCRRHMPHRCRFVAREPTPLSHAHTALACPHRPFAAVMLPLATHTLPAPPSSCRAPHSRPLTSRHVVHPQAPSGPAISYALARPHTAPTSR